MLSIAEAASWVAAQRAAGRAVVFTNGVFDLVHPGHVTYLAAARAEGDVLIVARQQRPVGARPTRAHRARFCRSTNGPSCWARSTCVDAVVVFDEETPAAIVAALQPDVLVKGADWAHDAIVGRDTVEARGGRVVRIDGGAGLFDIAHRRTRMQERPPSERSAADGRLRGVVARAARAALPAPSNGPALAHAGPASTSG